MPEIYRPYACPIETSFCLSEKDLSLMKHNSRMVILAVCGMCGWVPDGPGNRLADDPFVKFYFNSGNPDMNFLLDYHYAMHLAFRKVCGERLDLLGEQLDVHDLYRTHKQDCMDVAWQEPSEILHQKYLINSDRFWYKRHFQNLADSRDRVSLHKNGEITTEE